MSFTTRTKTGFYSRTVLPVAAAFAAFSASALLAPLPAHADEARVSAQKPVVVLLGDYRCDPKDKPLKPLKTDTGTGEIIFTGCTFKITFPNVSSLKSARQAGFETFFGENPKISAASQKSAEKSGESGFRADEGISKFLFTVKYTINGKEETVVLQYPEVKDISDRVSLKAKITETAIKGKTFDSDPKIVIDRESIDSTLEGIKAAARAEAEEEVKKASKMPKIQF